MASNVSSNLTNSSTFSHGFCLPMLFTGSSMILCAYFLGIICFFGFIGNIFCVFKVIPNYLAKSVFKIYLYALMASDSGVLLTSFICIVLPRLFIHLKVTNLTIYRWLSYVIVVAYPSGMVCQTCSTWIITSMSIVRFLGVCYPLKTMALNKHSQGIVIIGSVIAFSLTYNVPRFLELKVSICNQPADTFPPSYSFWPTQLRQNAAYIKFYIGIIYMIVMFVFPFCLITLANLFTTVTLIQSNKSSVPSRELRNTFRRKEGKINSAPCQILITNHGEQVAKPKGMKTVMVQRYQRIKSKRLRSKSMRVQQNETRQDGCLADNNNNTSVKYINKSKRKGRRRSDATIFHPNATYNNKDKINNNCTSDKGPLTIANHYTDNQYENLGITRTDTFKNQPSSKITCDIDIKTDNNITKTVNVSLENTKALQIEKNIHCNNFDSPKMRRNAIRIQASDSRAYYMLPSSHRSTTTIYSPLHNLIKPSDAVDGRRRSTGNLEIGKEQCGRRSAARGSPNVNFSRDLQGRDKLIKNTQNNSNPLLITTLLTFISVTFLACNATPFVTNILEFIGMCRELLSELTDYGNVLVCLNSSMNFGMYMLSSAKFRASLCRLRSRTTHNIISVSHSFMNSRV